MINRYFGLFVLDLFFLKVLGICFVLMELLLSAHTFYFFIKYGKGNPIVTEGTNKFVEKGLYKYTRNPMYLGHISYTLGLFLFFGHFSLLVYAILIFLAIHLIVIKWEEPDLRKKFKKSYLEYCKMVRRWL